MTQVKKRGHSYRSAYMGVAPPPPNPTTHKHAHTQSLNLQVASYNEHTIALCAPDAASGTALLSMEFLKDLRWVGGHTHMSVNKQPCGARLPDVPWAHTHLYLPHQSPHTPKTNTYQPTHQPTHQPTKPTPHHHQPNHPGGSSTAPTSRTCASAWRATSCTPTAPSSPSAASTSGAFWRLG